MVKKKEMENMKPITVFLPLEAYNVLSDREKETRRSKSSMIREAVIEWLRR